MSLFRILLIISLVVVAYLVLFAPKRLRRLGFHARRVGLAYVAAIVAAGGGWMEGLRLLVPAWPLVVIAGFARYPAAWRRGRPSSGRSSPGGWRPGPRVPGRWCR